MQKIITLLLLCALPLPAFAQTPSTEPQYYLEQFETLDRQALHDAEVRAILLNMFRQPASAQEVTAAMQFLRDKISKGTTDAGYYEAYAGLGWSVGRGNRNDALMNTATVMTIATILMYQTDELRCSDKGHAQKLFIDSIRNLTDPLLYFRRLTPEQQEKIVANAKPFEEKLKHRDVNRHLCGNTESAINDAHWHEQRKILHANLLAYLAQR